MQLLSIANFSTHFVFSMYSDDNYSQGDGIAFFLSSESTAYNIPQFKTGRWFGLVGDYADKLPDLFAVAFDSRQNMVGTFNHDFSSLHCLKNASLSALNNETIWEAWIDYNSETPELQVYLASGSHSLKSHQNLILSQRVNLSEYLSGNVSIGFSSAAVNSDEPHNIFSWSFNSSFYPKITTVGSKRNFNSKNSSRISSKNSSIGVNGLEMSLKGKDQKQLSTSTKILLGIGCRIVVCVAGAVWVSFFFLRRKKVESVGEQMLVDMHLDKLLYHIPRRFKLDDLVAGTSNFSEALKLGQGGFGGVYKCNLKLGQGGFGGVYKCNLAQTKEIVAAKRVSEG